MSVITSPVGGARGESFADVARRTGLIAGVAVAPTDTDQEVLDKQVGAATVVVAQAAGTVSAAIGGGLGIFGGPSLDIALNADGSPQTLALSRQVWIDPAPVPRDGILTSVSALVVVVGAVILGFVDSDGNVMLRLTVTFTATGAQTVAVSSAIVRSGWRFGQLSDGVSPSGTVGYSTYGYALNAPPIAAGTTSVGDLTAVQNATLGLGYTLDAKDA